MIYKVEFDLPVYRFLFPYIYNRILEFGAVREWPESEVKNRIIALLLNDPSTHLLIALDGNKITAHALYSIQYPNLILEQCQVDNKKDTTTASEFIQYGDDLAKTDPNLKYMIGITTRNELKALEKKYGFTYYNTIIRRDLSTIHTDEEKT